MSEDNEEEIQKEEDLAEENENEEQNVDNEEDNKNLLITQVNTVKSKQQSYLNNKLSQMNISDKLISGIKTGIEKANVKIKDDITSQNISVKDNKKDIDKILAKLSKKGKSDKFSIQEVKYLKSLEEERKTLTALVSKTEEVLKLLETESVKGLKGDLVEENKRNFEKKNLLEKKELMEGKLKLINYHINDYITTANKEDKNKIIKKYLESFQEDKEKIEEKLKGLREKEEVFRERMKKDLSNSIEKKRKRLDSKEKEEEEKKKQKLEEIKEKNKEATQKRKKEMDSIAEKSKKYLTEKPQKQKEDYLFSQMKNKYEAEENKLFNKVKATKKDPLVSKEEIEELRKKLEELQIKNEEQAKKSKETLNEIWKTRQQTIPEYKGPFYNDYLNQKEDAKDEAKEKMKTLLEVKIKYSQEKIPKQEINEQLKLSREKNMTKETKGDIMLLESKNKKKNEAFKVPIPKKLNKKINSLDIDSTPNKERKGPKIFSKKFKLLPIPEKPYDYLTEMRNSSQSKKSTKKRFYLDIKFSEQKNPYESMQMLKSQTDVIDSKITEQRQLAKVNGGYKKNPGINYEIGNLLVDSIQAKLKLLENLNGEQNENS
ncbi:MAG: hypothetical protein MJ252_04975 [archaeon]|nr:hypothetical protein [archaeon]